VVVILTNFLLSVSLSLCFEMNFALGDKICLIVTKFNGYPQLQIRHCVTKNSKVIPTRVGINLILPQYAKLKKASTELLDHSEINQPCEKELGYGLSVRNNLNMTKGKTVRKILFFNDRTTASFEIGLPEFRKWCEYHDQLEEAIAEIKDELAEEKDSKKANDQLDFTRSDIGSVENYFIHLCALLARRAVSACFPCIACFKNLPWEESWNHTCIIGETVNLQNNGMLEIQNLLKSRESLHHKFVVIMNAYYQHLIFHRDVIFETFYTAFLKTLSGRQLIFDIVMSSISGDFFASNPQSS